MSYPNSRALWAQLGQPGSDRQLLSNLVQWWPEELLHLHLCLSPASKRLSSQMVADPWEPRKRDAWKPKAEPLLFRSESISPRQDQLKTLPALDPDNPCN